MATIVDARAGVVLVVGNEVEKVKRGQQQC